LQAPISLCRLFVLLILWQNDDRTLLIESTIRGQATIAEALVHGGADIDADDEVQHTLSLATSQIM
jgi:hypothetical protein